MVKNPFDSQVPTLENQQKISDLRNAYKEIYAILLTLPGGKYIGHSILALEQSSQWAIKGLAFDEGKNE